VLASAAEAMEFRILGPLEVSRDGVPVEIGGGQQRRLLAILLLHARETVSTDRLIDALWGERPPASAAKSLQINVSRLRKALGEGAVITHATGYAVQLAPDELDLDRFGALLEQGRKALAAGDARRAAPRLDEALALWRGPPLADLSYDDFAQTEIARLVELRLGAVEARTEAELALGRHAAALPEVEALVREHPLREHLRALLMLALYRSGRQADALETYRSGRRLLVEELGIEPGPELRELEQRILSQDPSLAPPTQPAPPLVRRLRRRPRLALIAGVFVLGAVALGVVLPLTLSGSSHTLSRVALNSIGVIDPKADAIVDQIPIGVPPSDVTTGAGGVWAVSGADRVLRRIDPRRRTIAKTVGLDGVASSVAVDRDAVWVLNGVSADPQPDVELSRVDPKYGNVLETLSTGSGYTDEVKGQLAVGAGALWSPGDPSNPADGGLLRIDPSTHRVTTIRGPGGPGITFGEGAVWIAGGDVTRIDPTTRLATSITVGPTGGPLADSVAVGDGSVWSANAYEEQNCFRSRCPPVLPGTVTRIDPRLDVVTETIPVGRDPVAIAVGEGAVWVANHDGRSISRIDPKTNRVVATIKLGNPPSEIAAGEGSIWVGVG
jgi:YVTN family beta-propeller protein